MNKMLDPKSLDAARRTKSPIGRRMKSRLPARSRRSANRSSSPSATFRSSASTPPPTSPTRRSRISACPAAIRSRAAPTRRCIASRHWTMRQIAGFGTGEDTNKRFKYLDRAGADRPLHRLRYADADGLRLRSSDERGRGRPRRRRRRHARRHGGALRRHRSGEHLGVDDHQSDGLDPARDVYRAWPRSAATISTSCPARSRPTFSRSTWRRRNTAFRSRPRCASCATASPTAPRT